MGAEGGGGILTAWEGSSPLPSYPLSLSLSPNLRQLFFSRAGDPVQLWLKVVGGAIFMKPNWFRLQFVQLMALHRLPCKTRLSFMEPGRSSAVLWSVK